MRNNRYGLIPHSWWSPQELSRELAGWANLFSDGVRNFTRQSVPRLTIEEENDSYLVKAALSGFDPEKIEVEVVGDFLTIRGEKLSSGLEDGERYLHRERSADHLEETVKLPGRVFSSKVEAKFSHGVLTVKLPREAEAKPKSIKVAVEK